MTLALLPNPQTVSANDLTASTFPPYTQDGFAHHLSSSGKVLAKSLRIRWKSRPLGVVKWNAVVETASAGYWAESEISCYHSTASATGHSPQALPLKSWCAQEQINVSCKVWRKIPYKQKRVPAGQSRSLWETEEWTCEGWANLCGWHKPAMSRTLVP